MYRIEVNALPPTLNAFWSGMHHRKRMAIKEEWSGLFLRAFQEAKLPKPLPKLDRPYQIHCTQFCKGNVRDSDNGIVGIKLVKDTLKRLGYIKDDDWETFNDGITSTRKGKTNKIVIHIL